jgi:hypothetical protein
MRIRKGGPTYVHIGNDNAIRDSLKERGGQMRSDTWLQKEVGKES